jgi:GTPase SAR1 family protein
MNGREFKKQIKKELEKLSGEQQVYFAWVAAVRTLPFLGYQGNFNFWKKGVRGRYLYAVFNALDYAAIRDFTVIDRDLFVKETTNQAARAAANSAADVAFVSAYTVSAAESIQNRYFRKNSTIQLFTIDNASVDSDAVQAAAFGTAVHATAEVANLLYTNSKRKTRFISAFQEQLVSDVQAIFREVELPVDIAFYGVIWDNFQEALKKEGCSYWGKLYETIFRNNFQVDQEELKTRIEKVPREIKEQGAAAVAGYLEKLAKGSRRLNEARILILGDKGSGKTCIARRLLNPAAPMTQENESTPGVDTLFWEPGDSDLNIRIWDFAGHTVTHAAHRFFLSERCVYLIVYDGRTDHSGTLTYWLDHMKNYGGEDSRAFILVNKKDKNKVDIAINTLKDRYPIEKLYSFSIKNDLEELEEFRKELLEFVENNPSWANQQIPQEYYEVKEELEEIFEVGNPDKGEEHITKERFLEIAANKKATDTNQLLKDLHALGVSLWYGQMEGFDTLILNPDWISNGVYQLINWANNKNKYNLAIKDFEKVFKENAKRYPEDQYPFLFNLMITYELAYEVEKAQQLVIPHLLKEDRPKELPNFPLGESIQLKYVAERPLPPNTISRFIVRHHNQIKKYRNQDKVWRYGVLLEDSEGTLALVREEDRTITVSLKGKNKTEFMSLLRDTLNNIFESYKSEQPQLKYRVERYGQISDRVEKEHPIWLSEQEVINYIKNQRPFYDHNLDQEIILDSLAKRFNLTWINLNITRDGNIYSGSEDHRKITNNTFNFNNCNINLQGNLNDLAKRLAQKGHTEEAEELEGAAALLEKIENPENKDEVKKKGVMSRLQSIVEDLGDEDSTLHKSVKGLKKGVKIAQDIGKRYNDIAQWVGWPQVPKPFL